MTYSIWVPIIAGAVIIVLSAIWGLYFIAYLKKQQKTENKSGDTEVAFLTRLRPVIVRCCTCIVCAIFLGNSDDEVSEALNYIKPSKHVKNIWEKANEQTGI